MCDTVLAWYVDGEWGSYIPCSCIADFPSSYIYTDDAPPHEAEGYIEG